MKKHVTFTAFILLAFLGFTSDKYNDAFQEVIDSAENSSIREKLVVFRKGGIEKKVQSSGYDAEKLIAYAKTFLGTPHQMGGKSQKGIDCSGLVMKVHAEFGIQLPHSSHEQARYGRVISSQDDLRPGDLVFFYKSYVTSKLITHSGIYLGGGDFIHTSNSKGVTISRVNDPYYWGERYLFGTRLVE